MSSRPPRVLGLGASLAIVAGSMLGIGIFLTPPVVAGASPDLATFFGCWVIGALMALAGATAYAELGAAWPEAGGDYVYLGRAFGPRVAFAAGWVMFAGAFCGSLATMAVAVCQYQLDALLAAAGIVEAGALSRPTAALGLTGAQLGAIVLLVALTALNVLGARVSGRAQVAITVVPFVVFAGAAAWALGGEPTPLEVTPATATLDPRALASAVGAVYFAYAGWNAVSYVAGEVIRPARTIPLALLGATGLVALLYLLLCGGLVAVLGLGGLAGAGEAGSAAAAQVWGDAGVLLFTTAVLLAIVGSINATVLGGGRVVYAMGREGVMARPFGTLSRRGTPARPLWLQLGIASLLVVSGTFDTLLAMTTMAMMLLSTLTIIGLWRLRRRAPEVPRPYRATGNPVVPGFFVLGSVVVIGLGVWDAVAPRDPSTPPWERALPLLGLLVFVVLLAVGGVVRRSAAGVRG